MDNIQTTIFIGQCAVIIAVIVYLVYTITSYKRLIEDLLTRLRATEKTLANVKADHAAEIHRISKHELNVEQLALAFDDIGREGEMILKITRLDPNAMYRWRDRKSLEEDIKL